MPKNVKCKNCDKLKNHWCRAVIDSPDEDIVRDCRHFRHKTNGDRIRAMSDEELVAWAHKQIGCGFEFFPCGIVCNGKCESYSTEACGAKILDWLNKPAEVDNES